MMENVQFLASVAEILGGVAMVFAISFGFSPSSRFGIDSEYDVPEEVFMAMELKPEALSGKTGQVRYHPAFSSV